jgi:hypothetical protein
MARDPKSQGELQHDGERDGRSSDDQALAQQQRAGDLQKTRGDAQAQLAVGLAGQGKRQTGIETLIGLEVG